MPNSNADHMARLSIAATHDDNLATTWLTDAKDVGVYHIGATPGRMECRQPGKANRLQSSWRDFDSSDADGVSAAGEIEMEASQLTTEELVARTWQVIHKNRKQICRRQRQSNGSFASGGMVDGMALLSPDEIKVVGVN